MTGIPNLPTCFSNNRNRTPVSPRHNAAFSLVELLVVVAIITTLAAILLPGLSRIRERAWNVVCLSNLRQLAVAEIVYATDNKGVLPLCRRNNELYNPARWGILCWGETWPNYGKFLVQIWGASPSSSSWARRPPGKYLTSCEVFYCPGYVRHASDHPEFKTGTWNNWKSLPDLEAVFGIYGNSGVPYSNQWTKSNAHKIGYIAFGSGRKDLPSDRDVPTRVVPKKQRLTYSSPPVCWLFTDLYHRINGAGTPSLGYDYIPHYVGQYHPGVTCRYNVVHLDGHADAHQIDPLYIHSSRGWWGRNGDWGPYGNANSDGSSTALPLEQVTGVDTENDRVR